MPDCVKCGAALPPYTLICGYCRTRNDIDLQAVSPYTKVPAPETRICPTCGIVLQSLDLKIDGHFYIERCEQCFGLFFDPDELEKVLDSTVSNVYRIDYKQISALAETPVPASGEIRYLKCPVCRQYMHRRSYGLRSGVVVDACHDHGTWLEGGELRRLLEWRKSGGKLLDEERRETQAEEKKKAERRKKKGGASILPACSTDNYHSSSAHQQDIADMIIEFVCKLFK